MEFIWQVEPNVGNIIFTLGIISIIYACLFLVFKKTVNRTIPYLLLGISFILIILSYLFNCLVLSFVVASMSTAVITVSLVSNLGDLRKFMANPFHRNGKKAIYNGIEKIYDRIIMLFRKLCIRFA